MTNALRFAGTEHARIEELEANSSLRAHQARQRSAELEERTKAFLAAGGKIDEIPRGVSYRDQAVSEARDTELNRLIRASVERHKAESAERSERGLRAQGRVSKCGTI